MQKFIAPDFLSNQDAETIHKRMMGRLPPDIDDTEGGFPWDFTKPVALEKAEMLEFHLVETLKIMFPMWANGKWLDYHAKGRGMERKPANQASGGLMVTGITGTTIPAGFKFATPSIDDKPSIEYEAKEKYTIGEDGTIEIQVMASEAGTKGNVPAGTITLMMTPMEGITSITNQNPITGGAEEESDDALRGRIDEADAASEASFVGSDSDYKGWSEEVPGVGTALIVPEWAGPGTVKVVVIDANGQPANQTIIDDVYNHIMRPDDRLQRKAPIGATVTVVAPMAKDIDYTFALEMRPGETEEVVMNRFKERLQGYYVEAKLEGVVRYSRIGALLSSTSGVKDYTDLTMNGDTENIIIDEDEYPVTGLVDPGGGTP